MSLSQLKFVAVPLILTVAIGLAVYLGILSARQRRLAQLSTRQPEPEAVLERPLPYSETTPVAAEVPSPEEYSMSVQMQFILFQTFYNARMFERDLLRNLPEGAVVLRNPPLDRQNVAVAYHRAHVLGQEGEVVLASGSALSILTAGPLLQPYDQVVVRNLTRRGSHVELQVAYAHAQTSRSEVPPAEGWRPLLLVPLLLPEGSYELRTTWWKYAAPSPTTRLEDSKPLDQPPLEYRYRFKLTDGLAESPVVRAAGADFQALAEGPCRMPTDTEWRGLHLGFRITNRSEKPLLFDPRGLQLLPGSIKAADGRQLRYGGDSDGTIVARPVSLPPGKSHVFILRTMLEWGRASEALRLSGSIGSGDYYWYYYGLMFGTHQLTFEYGVSPQPLRPPETYWTGRVRSAPVALEIVP
jgi:hypothetical protein